MDLAQKIETLEAQLNDFALDSRTEALQSLLALVERGDIELPPPQEVANMHCHTFFSFNGYGHSPTSLAWLGRRRGFKLMGIVDFDVLDAFDEFLAACDRVGLRGSAGIETRVFIPEFASRVINSPGEPGVYYHMGIGFTSSQVPAEAAPILTDMRRRATERNQDVLARVNAHLAPVMIDYEKDVLPFTPNGNPTERHLLAAYMPFPVTNDKAVMLPIVFKNRRRPRRPDGRPGFAFMSFVMPPRIEPSPRVSTRFWPLDFPPGPVLPVPESIRFG